MKKAISVLTAAAMVWACSTVALAAEWNHSQIRNGVTLAQNQVKVTGKAGETTTMDVTDGGLRITNLKETLEGTSALDAASNDKVNLVYAAVAATNSTSTMLAKFANSSETTSALAAQIAANKAATVERLTAKKDELSAKVNQLKADGAGAEELAAAAQELAQVEGQIAATEAEGYESMDHYEPVALFDVSVSGNMEQALAGGGSVEVPVKVDGITEDSDVLALHFMGDVKDAAALTEELKTNTAAVVEDMRVEVLPCVAGDSMVTLTMSSFSPVMILTRAQAEAVVGQLTEQGAGEKEALTTTPETSEAQEATATEGTPWIWGGIALILVVIAGAVVVTRKGKQKTAAGNKK